MFKKFVLASELRLDETRFNARLVPNTSEVSKHYAVSGCDGTYVITCQDPHLIQIFKFGMTPFYANEPMNLTNARAEGDNNGTDNPDYNGSKAIFLKQAFRKPIQSQRCLVIADAYYEWSNHNNPYLVFLQNKSRPFAFAGIYDSWIDPETKDIDFSFAIITTVANRFCIVSVLNVCQLYFLDQTKRIGLSRPIICPTY